MTGPDDSELMRRVQAGDRHAFGVLVDRHKDALVNYLTRMVGCRERAQDVAQDAFLRLYQHSGRYRESGRLSPYLYRIATNLMRTDLRKESRRRTLFQMFMLGDRDGNGGGPSPQTQLLQKESQQQLQDALVELPFKFRQPLVLFEIEGWSYNDIARSIGCREGTVKSRISRGRQRLRCILGPYVNGNGNGNGNAR